MEIKPYTDFRVPDYSVTTNEVGRKTLNDMPIPEKINLEELKKKIDKSLKDNSATIDEANYFLQESRTQRNIMFAFAAIIFFFGIVAFLNSQNKDQTNLV